MSSKQLQLIPYAVATLLSAFLVFQVQPMISKVVLPWYGGSPAVWTTCVLFFQVVLFAGYLYAHLLNVYLAPRWQGAVHALLLCVSVASLPITPSAAWQPVGGEPPITHLLLLLLIHVGIPYFALSATGPLVQAWLSLDSQHQGVYRLYALSNIGSLAALLSYPVVVEPLMNVGRQAQLWGLLFSLFVVMQGWLATRMLRVRNHPPRQKRIDNSERPAALPWAMWLFLPAFASVVLLAFTNHLCQEVAVVPFLWVLPLAVYLLTFILAFDSPRWYRPRLFALCGCAVLITASIIESYFAEQLVLQIGVYAGLIFFLCMVCHGEVARLRPPTQRLTHYYLAISAGGALGSLFVAILCPLLFDSYLEFALAEAIGGVILLVVALGYDSRYSTRFRLARVRRLAIAGSLLSVAGVGLQSWFRSAEARIEDRNFFGVLRVLSEHPGTVSMVHGKTVHGLQITAPRDREPTMYYGRESGVGRTLRAFAPRGPLRVATVGLGVGTLACYGRPGDQFEFFEINPAVQQLAEEYFTFLNDSRADVRVLLGDGRLALQRQPPRYYDLIVLDAFSSDSVPAHLLTVEAMRLYGSRLKPNGAIAFHVSNKYLDLAPVVHRLADAIGAESRWIESAGSPSEFTSNAEWVIVSADDRLWNEPPFAGVLPPQDGVAGPLWRDDFHHLLDVLR